MSMGSVCFVQPRRCERRCTWVSTTTPSGEWNATPRTTFAVLRPTPGSFASSARVRGTSPPWFATSVWARARGHCGEVEYQYDYSKLGREDFAVLVEMAKTKQLERIADALERLVAKRE